MAATIRERLDALYARVPADGSPCPRRCRECCGPIPMTKTEWERIREAHPHTVEPHLISDGTHVAARDVVVDGQTRQRCPFCRDDAKKRGCSVYEQRPLVCRLYASSAAMRCLHGCGADEPLSLAEHQEILAEYDRIRDDDR